MISSIDQLGKKREIFDGRASILHTGTEFGIVHPKDPRFSTQFARLLEITGQDRILFPQLGFNTKVTPVGGIEDLQRGVGMRDGVPATLEGFYRTSEASDGVVVSITGDTRLKIAVATMHADCCVVKVLAPNGELAFLHSAFNCIDPPNGGPSIVQNAIGYFQEQGFEPSELQVAVGEAARKCCYGLKTDDPTWAVKNQARAGRLARTYGDDVIGTVTSSPLAGGIGFDHSLIAARQAEQLGVQDIDFEELCTSCFGMVAEALHRPNRHGKWFSHSRESQDVIDSRGYGSRGAVVVYPSNQKGY